MHDEGQICEKEKNTRKYVKDNVSNLMITHESLLLPGKLDAVTSSTLFKKTEPVMDIPHQYTPLLVTGSLTTCKMFSVNVLGVSERGPRGQSLALKCSRVEADTEGGGPGMAAGSGPRYAARAQQSGPVPST